MESAPRLLLSLCLVSLLSGLCYATCPSDWEPFLDEKCITYIGFNFPYSEAGFSCRGRHPNATLVSVHSVDEEKLLISMARHHLKGKHHQWIWLGANKKNEDTSFSKWNDTSDMVYANWYEGLGYSCPDIDPTRNCLAMGIYAEKDGSIWCNFDCDSTFHWFCQLSLTTGQPASSSVDTSSLSTGERLPFSFSFNYETHTIGNMNLALFPDPVSGEEAPLLCPFGEMITVHSKEQEDELIDFLKTNVTLSKPVLIGVKRNGTGSDDSNFYWTDGSDLNYTNWAQYEPNFKRENEYCVILDLESRGWRDVSCTSKYHLLCDQYIGDATGQGILNWLFHQYFERAHLSLVIWLVSILCLILLVILLSCIYIAFKHRISRMALQFNHETQAYSDIRKQTECECFSNLHDK